MKNQRKFINAPLAIILALLVLVSIVFLKPRFNAESPLTISPTTDLQLVSDKTWQLKSYTLENHTENVPKNIVITLKIDADKKRISGYNVCNNYFGEILIDNALQTITFDRIGSTMAGCMQEAGKYHDHSFVKILTRVNKLAKNGKSLVLYNDMGDQLEFYI